MTLVGCEGRTRFDAMRAPLLLQWEAYVKKLRVPLRREPRSLCAEIMISLCKQVPNYRRTKVSLHENRGPTRQRTHTHWAEEDPGMALITLTHYSRELYSTVARISQNVRRPRVH